MSIGIINWNMKAFVDSYESKLKDNLLKEKQHDIQWWRDLLKALDINIDTDNIIFRDNVSYASKNGKSSNKESDVIIKIDPKNPVLIENKGSDVDLDKPEHRSSFDNTNRMVTPLQQVWDYYDLYVKNNGCNPKYIITMNFHTIRVYDMSNGPRGLIKSKEFKTNKNIDAYIPNFIFTFDGDNDNDPSSRKNNNEMPKPLDIRNDDNATILRRILSGKDVPDAEATSKQIADAMVSIRNEILSYIVKSKLNQTSISNADINAYNEFINAIILLMFMGRSGILSPESDNPDDSEFEKWLSNTENFITNNNFKPENAFKRLFTWLGASNDDRVHLDSMIFEQFIGAVAGSGYYFKPICGYPFINDANNNTTIKVPPIPVEVYQKIKRAYLDYNWQNIDAALFGSMQEDLLNDVKILETVSNTASNSHIKVSTGSGSTRKQGGIHWTAKQYIHSVIDPLFLDDLQAKVSNVINPKSTVYSKTHTINSIQVDENGNTISIDVNANPTVSEQIERIQQVHAELATIRLFDPACGSGNFLTESYQSLRHLENLLLKRLAKLGCQITQDDILVSTDSFGGIEIEETGVSVARISMHIARLIALKDLANTKPGDKPIQVDYYSDWSRSDGFIRSRIAKDNALRIDWNSIMPAHANRYMWIKKRQSNNTISFESYTDYYDGNPNSLPQVGSMLADESHGNVMVDYIAVKPVRDVMIIGNPPFISQVNRSDEQTSELADVMGDDYQGFTDYCAGWLYKSADYIKPASDASFTFITTSGLATGQSAMKVIQPLIDKHNVHMQFARTKFSWNNSSFDTSKAVVDVVVTSWVNGANNGKIKNCRIYDALSNSYTNANVIDSHLSNNNLRVIKSTNPISNNIIKAIQGFYAIDNGTLTITTDDELNEALNDTVIKKHPEFLVKCINGQQLLTGSSSQYFLWLKDSTKEDRDNSPFISKHVEACSNYRCSQTSKSSHAAKLKDTPWLTDTSIRYNELFLAIPETFSTKYNHVMGDYFDSNKTICKHGTYLINSSDMMQYSLIQSTMYIEWLNLVGGKLRGAAYKLSPTLSWHTFPFPNDLSPSMHARLRAAGKRIMIALTDDPAGSLQLVVDKLHAGVNDVNANVNISNHIGNDGLPDDLAWGVLDDVDDEAFIRLMMGRRSCSLSSLNDNMPSILKSAYEYNDEFVDECIVNNAYTKYNTKDGSAWDALIDDRLFNEHLELIKYPLDSNGRVDCLSKAYRNMTATTATSK